MLVLLLSSSPTVCGFGGTGGGAASCAAAGPLDTVIGKSTIRAFVRRRAVFAASSVENVMLADCVSLDEIV